MSYVDGKGTLELNQWSGPGMARHPTLRQRRVVYCRDLPRIVQSLPTDGVKSPTGYIFS